VCSPLQLTVTDSTEINDTAVAAIAANSPALVQVVRSSLSPLSFLPTYFNTIVAIQIRMLNCPKVGDEAVAALSHNCPHLNKLLLSNCAVSSRVVLPLPLCSVLFYYYHRHANSVLVITQMAFIATLRLLELDLSYCSRLTKDSIEQIVQGLAAHTLRKVSLEVRSLLQPPSLDLTIPNICVWLLGNVVAAPFRPPASH
jgi:hypothetical protein